MPVVSRAAPLVAPVACQVDMTMAFSQTICPGIPFFPAPRLTPFHGSASLSLQPRPNHASLLCGSVPLGRSSYPSLWHSVLARIGPHSTFQHLRRTRPSKKARLPVLVQAFPPCRAQDPAHGMPSLCHALPFHYPHLQTVSIHLSMPSNNHLSP